MSQNAEVVEELAEGVFAVTDEAVLESALWRNPGVSRVLLGVERWPHLEGETSNVGLVEKVGLLVANQERRAARELAGPQMKAGFLARFANGGLDEGFFVLSFPAGEPPATREGLAYCAL